MANKDNGKTQSVADSTERGSVCAHCNKQLAINISSSVLILSPCDEAGGDSGPGDAAGVGLLALLLLVFTAAAQTAQVDGQTQQVEAEPCSRHAAQEYERLRIEREREGGEMT